MSVVVLYPKLSCISPAKTGAIILPRLYIELNKQAVISHTYEGSYLSSLSKVSISSESKGTNAIDKLNPIIETPITIKVKLLGNPSKELGPESKL